MWRLINPCKHHFINYLKHSNVIRHANSFWSFKPTLKTFLFSWLSVLCTTNCSHLSFPPWNPHHWLACLCVCVTVCVWLCACDCVCVCVWLCAWLCACDCVRVTVCVWLCVWLCACDCVCLCACDCVRVTVCDCVRVTVTVCVWLCVCVIGSLLVSAGILNVEFWLVLTV